MSQSAISNALETRLNNIAGALPTAWENMGFTIQAGVAHQQVNIMFSEPENPVMNGTFNRQRGYLLVRLRYPLNTGRNAALQQAEAIKNWFYRGLSLQANGVTTIIDRTPAISKGGIDDDRYVVNVRVYFFANLDS